MIKRIFHKLFVFKGVQEGYAVKGLARCLTQPCKLPTYNCQLQLGVTAGRSSPRWEACPDEYRDHTTQALITGPVSIAIVNAETTFNQCDP